MSTPAKKLIEHYGDIRSTSVALGCSYETVRQWSHTGIPLERAIDIEKLTRCVVTAEEIVSYWRNRSL